MGVPARATANTFSVELNVLSRVPRQGNRCYLYMNVVLYEVINIFFNP